MHMSYNIDEYASKMVTDQIRSRGIIDEEICSLMERIPRWLFVSSVSKDKAYGDHPISIGHGQTISQPYMVALMTQLLDLRDTDNVLEVGTGSGYQTAILAELARHIYTIERIDSLLLKAESLLRSLGYTNISFLNEDGSGGWEPNAPYDKIIVTAAAPAIPILLKNQLSDNGKLVIPVGDYKTYQVLKVVTRIGNSFREDESIGCRFVPLVGKNAFAP
jgi:protein-L-isoaspartate(D-aspartate) O-methyltransferase